MFKFNKTLPILAASLTGIGAAYLVGGTFCALHAPPVVYMTVSAISFVGYAVLSAFLFKDYKEVRDYFVTPGTDRLAADDLFINPDVHLTKAQVEAVRNSHSTIRALSNVSTNARPEIGDIFNIPHAKDAGIESLFIIGGNNKKQ